MDKKSKIFFIVLGLLVAGSVAFTYLRIMVFKDYTIEGQIDCDPYEKSCFVWECDPNAIDESEKCTGDPEEDIWYYSLLHRNASRVPLCDPEEDENCQALVCDENEPDCGEVFCDDETKLEQEVECSGDPVKFAEENPIEEDEEECAEDDPECEAEAEECAEDDPECVEVEAEDGISEEEMESAAGGKQEIGGNVGLVAAALRNYYKSKETYTGFDVAQHFPSAKLSATFGDCQTNAQIDIDPDGSDFVIHQPLCVLPDVSVCVSHSESKAVLVDSEDVAETFQCNSVEPGDEDDEGEGGEKIEAEVESADEDAGAAEEDE